MFNITKKIMSDHGEKEESKSVSGSEKRWVKFDENTSDSHADGVRPAAAVIVTETVLLKLLLF